MADNDAGADHNQSGSEPHWLHSFDNTEARSDVGNNHQSDQREGEPVEDDAAPAADDHDGHNTHQDTTGLQVEPEEGAVDSDGSHDSQLEEELDDSDAGQEEQEEQEPEAHWYWSFNPHDRPEQGTDNNADTQMNVREAFDPYNEVNDVQQEVFATAYNEPPTWGMATNPRRRSFDTYANDMAEGNHFMYEEGAGPTEDEVDDVVEEDTGEEVDDEAEEDVEEEVEETAEDNQEATGDEQRNEQRCPKLVRSDPHVRLPQDDPVPQDARTVGTGDNAGRNLLALFGDDHDPRTRYRLRIERARGRGNRAAFRDHPDSREILPARLTLHDICAKYPNHAWGSALRMFEAEGWDGRRIWEALPQDARHEGARDRPWNYIQRVFTRERETVFHERTGTRWQDHRGPQRPRRRAGAPATPQPAAPMQPQLPIARNRTERLEQFAGLERQRAVQIIRRLFEVLETDHPPQDAQTFLRRQHDSFLGRVNQMLGVPQPGQDPSPDNIVNALQTIRLRQNPWVTGTYVQWQQAGREAALHMYLVNLQGWIQSAQQELNQARGGNGQVGGQP